MKNLIKYFIRYPVMGNAILALIFCFGFFAYLSTTTTFFPDEQSKMIIITASYPGASPEEIEEGITLKVEDNLKGLTGIERITSSSSENVAQIFVELKYGTDPNVALQEVQNAVNSVSSFPVGMEKINVFKQEWREFVIGLSLNGEIPLRDLKKNARRVERDLRSIEGISKVTLSGFPDEEIEVSFREHDLRAYGLRFDEVARAIQAANVKVTGGKIKGAQEELLIRADNKMYYAEELKNHVIKTTSDGTVIFLKDVADVVEKWSEDPNRIYFNGKPALRIDIEKTKDEDLLYIVKSVYGYVEEFNASHSEVQIAILRDAAEIIQERIDILTDNGMIGIILVLLFLGLSLNPRLSFWVALSIPLSFLGMFMMGQAYGLTINIMSLMGMILVIGILVDDGIVIAENIYQHYEKGEKPMQAAVAGTIEVLPSVISAVMTTIVIFLIFFFLEGGIGEHAGDIAFVVISTLIISLVEAVFILPAHIAHSKALKKAPGEKNWLLQKSENVLFAMRDRFYAPALKFVISHPVVSLTMPVALGLITLGAINGSIIKTTFFPVLEFNNLTITLEMPAGTRDSITDSLLEGIEENAWQVNDDYVKNYPDFPPLIVAVTRKVGSGTHQGSLSLRLVGSEERELTNLQVRQKLRAKIGQIPGAEKLQIGGGGRWGMPVSISLQSDDLNSLRDAKLKLKNELRRFKELKDIVDNDPVGLQEVHISLKEKAFALGLTTSQVMSQVRSGFFGQEAQRILRGIDEVRIWVRYGEKERASISQLEDMRIRLANGQAFPLGAIADISIDRGVMTISHIDAQRNIKVEADIAHPKVSVPDILDKIKTEIMPGIKVEFPDVSFNFEGESRENAKTMSAFAQVIPPMLLLMFMIVVVTFRSFSQAFIVYLMVPFAMVGVAWGHFFQGYIVSMLSFFGAIALIGIVVNDSLVFISTMNRNLKDGKEFIPALYEAGISRFRPVFLTSATTIAGLGPLIFETSKHAQFLSPMAISVAYGLLFGTLLTLLMLPALLVANNKIKLFFLKLRTGERVAAHLVEPAVREELFAKENA